MGSNNPSLFTTGMLNNASRCVSKPAEMRTGFPIGSLNLFFLICLSLPPLSLSAHSASECRDINLLSLAVRVGGRGSLRLGAISCVCVRACVDERSCMCLQLPPIIHFNGRKQCGKIHHAAGTPCKSWINTEWEVFMLQLTADGSIPKNAWRRRERLFAITIHYYSIRIHGENTSVDTESRAATPAQQRVNVVQSSMWKILHPFNSVNLVT